MSEGSVDAAIGELSRACRVADICEVRVDAITSGDLTKLFRSFPRPVILTARRREEGGTFRGSEEERLQLLARVLSDSPHFVDVEASSAPAELGKLVGSGRALVSRHDFRAAPRDIAGVLRGLNRIARGGPIKYACTATRLFDTLRVRDALARSEAPSVCFAMGQCGVLTRVLSPSWGSLLTYGAARDARRTAPGQLTLDELARLYRVRSIGPRTRLYAVAGRDVSRSKSPLLHNTIFGKVAADAVYTVAPAEHFSEILKVADALGIVGLSVTAPFKAEALRAAATATVVARAVGAANTLVRRRGRWHAENTDVAGFLGAIQRHVILDGCEAVVIGTGGAARGAAWALAKAGARVTVLGRDEGKGRRVAALAGGVFVGLGTRIMRSLESELWVNATTAGDPLPEGFLRSRKRRGLAFDHSYASDLPPFLEKAKEAGFAVQNGLAMLLGQGLRQGRLFLRRDVSLPAARAAARALGTTLPSKR